MSRSVSSRRGFTLLELLVVMVIIGLLAGYVGPKFFGQIGKSEVKAAKAQLDALQKALDQYRLDVGRYPSTDQGLAVLVTKPADEPKWAGPYLARPCPRTLGQRLPIPQPRRARRVRPLSSAGRPGGEGEDADITSW
jgi:general secretion pathway protein G